MFNNQFKRTIALIQCVSHYLGNLPRRNTELSKKLNGLLKICVSMAIYRTTHVHFSRSFDKRRKKQLVLKM